MEWLTSWGLFFYETIRDKNSSNDMELNSTVNYLTVRFKILAERERCTNLRFRRAHQKDCNILCGQLFVEDTTLDWKAKRYIPKSKTFLSSFLVGHASSTSDPLIFRLGSQTRDTNPLQLPTSVKLVLVLQYEVKHSIYRRRARRYHIAPTSWRTNKVSVSNEIQYIKQFEKWIKNYPQYCDSFINGGKYIYLFLLPKKWCT